MNTSTVVLNITGMNAPQLINRARFYVQRVNDNISSFPSCVNAAANITVAADELELADQATADGGKSKFRIKADKEKALRAKLMILGHRVQEDANGDETIVHLAGMEFKKAGLRTIAEFKATSGEHTGEVKLSAKSRPGTIYKWQYATDASLATWVDAGISRGCRKAVSHLESGVYWFRVIFMDDEGEHQGQVLKIAVT